MQTYVEHIQIVNATESETILRKVDSQFPLIYQQRHVINGVHFYQIRISEYKKYESMAISERWWVEGHPGKRVGILRAGPCGRNGPD